MIDDLPGRTCPIRYRYGAHALASAREREADTLYVIGGLYGNLPALDTVEDLARAESVRPTLCFNGDFNWFDIADERFGEINHRVLAHDAILGNVEAELDTPSDEAGCGCAYPAYVEEAVIERSNRIHKDLKATAQRHPELLRRVAQLPMYARYRIADCRVAVVHGDADSLAGWRFDTRALAEATHWPWLQASFEAAEVDLFASTHTCLPAMRGIHLRNARRGWVVNNGAAGMPNFAGELAGLCTRIAATPSPHPTVHEVRIGDAHVALVPIAYDTHRWQAQFLAQWPAGSPAWLSYFDRISRGPSFDRSQVLRVDGPVELVAAEETGGDAWTDSHPQRRWATRRERT
jgi:hypothetical protein